MDLITNNLVGSPLISEQAEIGGIDLRSLPVMIQPGMVNSIYSLPVSHLIPTKNLDKEWLQIEQMVNAGIIPSSQRIKECLISSCLNGDPKEAIEKALSCVAEILVLEEENLSPLDADLYQLLAILESDSLAYNK